MIVGPSWPCWPHFLWSFLNSSSILCIWARTFSSSSVVVCMSCPLLLCSSSNRSATPETCSPSHLSHYWHVPCSSPCSPPSVGMLCASSFSGNSCCCSNCLGLRLGEDTLYLPGSCWPIGGSLCLFLGSLCSWVSTTTVEAGSFVRWFRSHFFERHIKVWAGSSSASSSMVSWRIFCMKFSNSCSSVHTLNIIRFCMTSHTIWRNSEA